MSDSDSGEGRALAELRREISSIKFSGVFATYGSIENFDNPGLQIDDESFFGLPLSVKDAKNLINLSHQAAFRKHSTSIVDESIRKTWQIDASSITFTNKNWERCLKRITQDAVAKLHTAPPANVNAELQQLLIYEEGGKFEQGQESVSCWMLLPDFSDH